MKRTPEVFDGRSGGKRYGAASLEADGAAEGTWAVTFLLLYARGGGVSGGELVAEVGKLGIDSGHRDEVQGIIREMEGEGMLASRVGERYATTDLGEAYLEFRAASLEHERRNANLFLRAYAERRSGGDLVRGRV